MIYYIIHCSDLLESVSKLGDYYNTAVVKDRNTGLPLKCEPDLQALFTKSRDYDELKWAWLAWRKQFGPEVKRAFTKSSDLMNKAARSNGLCRQIIDTSFLILHV